MWKRAMWMVLVVALVGAPAAAQEADPALTWIPADFAGYVRLEIRAQTTLTGLNIAGLAASFLQPQRLDFAPLQGLDGLLPLDRLDVETASFGSHIFPWLANELILAYPELGDNLNRAGDNALMILPTRDVLQSANSLSPVIQGQDLLERETYLGQTLYLADRTTLVFAPSAVLIGPTEAVKAALAAGLGEAERLVDTEAYAQVRPANTLLNGYVRGESVLPLLSYLINGDLSAQPTLEALGEALGTFQNAAGLEQLLLRNRVDAASFALRADTLRLNSVNVTVDLYAADYAGATTTADFNRDVLNLMPQNALLVHSGAQVQETVWGLLTALPLTNFASEIAGAFPIQPSVAAAAGALDTPNTLDIERAVGGMLATLTRQRSFDLEHDLLDHLAGSYSLALLPRPNNPLPPLNTPYDLLLVAEVDNPETALESTTRFIEIMLPLNTLETQTTGDYTFQVIQPDPIGEPALQFGLVDNLLVVATGAALEPALAAYRGDNRLINRATWQAVSGDTPVQLYLDIPAAYSTFLPQLVGPQLQQIKQMGAHSRYLGDGHFQLDLTVTLPGQFGS
jgi:hypothetical protein